MESQLTVITSHHFNCSLCALFIFSIWKAHSASLAAHTHIFQIRIAYNLMASNNNNPWLWFILHQHYPWHLCFPSIDQATATSFSFQIENFTLRSGRLLSARARARAGIVCYIRNLGIHIWYVFENFKSNEIFQQQQQQINYRKMMRGKLRVRNEWDLMRVFFISVVCGRHIFSALLNVKSKIWRKKKFLCSFSPCAV